MLVELGLVEQRYRAVLEVLNDGASVTDVAVRHFAARSLGWKLLGASALAHIPGIAIVILGVLTAA